MRADLNYLPEDAQADEAADRAARPDRRCDPTCQNGNGPCWCQEGEPDEVVYSTPVATCYECDHTVYDVAALKVCRSCSAKLCAQCFAECLCGDGDATHAGVRQ